MIGRFVPMVDSTHDDDDTNSHMSDIPLQLPESANVSSNIISWERPPTPNQTGANPWQVQYHVTYPCSVLAVLGPQEAVHLVTQQAPEALNDQRETARRALLHQEG